LVRILIFKDFTSLFNLFRTPVVGHDTVSALVCVQIVTSYLERFLGDVYITIKKLVFVFAFFLIFKEKWLPMRKKLSVLVC
jgi:hypothetical protein